MKRYLSTTVLVACSAILGLSCGGDSATQEQPAALGALCASDAGCESGTCADGVCCDRSCDSTCEACTAAATGGTDGACALAKAGQDPRNDCGGDIANCSGATCNGAGACAPVVDGMECRPAEGSCDVAETCAGGVCPADQLRPANDVCRDAAGPCDQPEICDGAQAACPTDARKDGQTVCRAAIVGGCDLAEICDGSNVDCPADQIAAAATVCRGAAGSCDVVEACDGVTPNCPSDGFLPAATTCGGTYQCPGNAGICPTACSNDEVCTTVSMCTNALTCVVGRRAFLTATPIRPAAIGGLAGADAVCQAAAGGHRGTYKAWLSTGAVSVASRMVQSPGPYLFQDGAKLADSWTDLTDGTIDLPFNRLADGAIRTQGTLVWTNTAQSGASAAPSSGTAPEDCTGWTLNTGPALAGQSSVTSTWSRNSLVGCDSQVVRLWCLQQ